MDDRHDYSGYNYEKQEYDENESCPRAKTEGWTHWSTHSATNTIKFLLFHTCISEAESDEVYIVQYAPFYLLYYIMMGLQTQFAQTAFSLARRYRRLNMAIESAFSLSE